jgi:hypothetical protein
VSVAKVTDAIATVGVVQTKALTPEQNEALRKVVRQIVDAQFGGKVSVAAKGPPKISHSMLFEFLNGNRGAGLRLLEWISARTNGKSIDELLGRPPAGLRVVPNDPAPARTAALAPFRNDADPDVQEAVANVSAPHQGTKAYTTEQWTRYLIKEIDDIRLAKANPEATKQRRDLMEKKKRDAAYRPSLDEVEARERGRQNRDGDDGGGNE